MYTRIYSASCPYCGENIDLLIDCSVDTQQYIEDCQVCCRPMTIRVVCNERGEVVSVAVMHENDA